MKNREIIFYDRMEKLMALLVRIQVVEKHYSEQFVTKVWKEVNEILEEK